MRDVTNIELDELIVHILNPKNPDGMVLSECPIPLEENQLLIDYFVGHIKNSLNNSTAKAASFEAIDQNLVSGICNDLLKGNTTLVDGSVRLAEKLYDIIAEDRRINPCDLAVCFYRVKNSENTEEADESEDGDDDEEAEDEIRYLAVLNIEPSEVFRHQPKTNPAGETYIGFEIEKDVMPTTGEKLQKCAFIQSLDPRPGYDMILLDRQKRGEEVAKFFVQDFLGAKLTFDDKNRTKKLYSGLINAKNKLYDELEPQQNELFDQAIRVAIQRAHINVETWVDGLPFSDDHKKTIKEEVSHQIPDIEFDLDTEFATTLVKKRSYRGDNKLRITYRTADDGNDDILQSVDRKEPPGEEAYYEVIIHTTEWEEIK